MSGFEWKEEYSVGVELIDTQHKMFVGILNDLYAAIMAQKEDLILDDIFDQLVKYTEFHFQTEERYFDEFHYEGSEEHKAEHARLCADIAVLREKKEGSLKSNPFELLDFLEAWLIEHIMDMDKKYTTCFHEHGLK